ncbi:type VI secretion system protein TssR domain-containing protein [Mucilaginibacter glaciei]|uniref:Type VI secretion system protein TssR n=1 Tax=Mucilaginibacter glaciei TaxID=2772109 RepID=A0A926S4C5_9SPHI|nr:type VI secretion system protein TssR domain-containing protein [Mucilaginibacter glaciei]MBD1391646.1 type VI secretion system protein TssR [Mucilaginibacter glaciei]
MKNILYVLTIFTTLAATAQSPVSFSKKVQTLPVAFEKPNSRTNIRDNGKKSSLPWIVFSDRAENYTYTAPGGSLVMKKIAFMQPFYVSQVQNGYVKLIKYEPGIVQGRKLTNKKAAQSYGWVSLDKMLLWQSAYVNPESGYAEKSITIASGKGPLIMSKIYFDKTDSLYVYNSPELEHKKTKVALHQLLYIYKRSADGKTVLVGSDGQLIADSASHSIYGWLPADAVHSWGNRLFIGSAKENGNFDSDDSVANVINNAITYNGAATRFVFDPLIDQDQPLLRSLPVLGTNGQTGKLQVGVATDVYDKSHNSIINLKGGHLTYQEYLSIRKNTHKINIVFVVDGGSSMRNYFSGLTNTIQSFENTFNLYDKGNQLSYAAVVYRGQTNCNAGGIVGESFNTDYRRIVKFLDKQAAVTSLCLAAPDSQPVFDGLRYALSMFKNHKNETNLIVLIGSTGNASADDLTDMSYQMAAADARLLAIQLYSDYNPIYNDFVIQSRKLVSQSAVLLADNKKKRMVIGEGLTSTQQYNVSLSDTVSFYLDYPKHSIIQGAVIFPPKGVVKTNQAMEAAVKRLMAETQLDIKTQTHSLDSVFRLTGREHRFVQQVVTSQFTAPVPDSLGDDMPHNAFKYFLQANLPANVVTANKGQLQYLVILNEAEYKQMTDILSMMIGENLQQDAGNYRSQLYKNYVSIVRNYMGLKDFPKSAIGDMQITDYITKTTGLIVPANKSLGGFKVEDIKDEGKMPQAQFEAYINYLIKCRNTIKQQALLQQHFVSNGQIYYYVTQANWNN